MRGHKRILFLTSLSLFVLCSFVPYKDKHYVDYFLHLYSAELFREKQFNLISVRTFYGWQSIDRIYIKFSCFRSLSLKEARALLIETADNLMQKINNDPILIEKHLLLGGHFCAKQLHLTIEAGNVFTETMDNSTSIKTVSLSDGVITYETFKTSVFLRGGRKIIREAYRDAVLLTSREAGRGIGFDIETQLEKNLSAAKARKTEALKIQQQKEEEALKAAQAIPRIVEHAIDNMNSLGKRPSIPPRSVLVEELNFLFIPPKEPQIQAPTQAPIEELPPQAAPEMTQPAQPEQVKIEPVQKVTTPEVPAQEVPTQEVPTQEVPVQEVPVQEVPVQQTPEVQEKAILPKAILPKAILPVEEKKTETLHPAEKEHTQNLVEAPSSAPQTDEKAKQEPLPTSPQEPQAQKRVLQPVLQPVPQPSSSPETPSPATNTALPDTSIEPTPPPVSVPEKAPWEEAPVETTPQTTAPLKKSEEEEPQAPQTIEKEKLVPKEAQDLEPHAVSEVAFAEDEEEGLNSGNSISNTTKSDDGKAVSEEVAPKKNILQKMISLIWKKQPTAAQIEPGPHGLQVDDKDAMQEDSKQEDLVAEDLIEEEVPAQIIAGENEDNFDPVSEVDATYEDSGLDDKADLFPCDEAPQEIQKKMSFSEKLSAFFSKKEQQELTVSEADEVSGEEEQLELDGSESPFDESLSEADEIISSEEEASEQGESEQNSQVEESFLEEQIEPEVIAEAEESNEEEQPQLDENESLFDESLPETGEIISFEDESAEQVESEQDSEVEENLIEEAPIEEPLIEEPLIEEAPIEEAPIEDAPVEEVVEEDEDASSYMLLTENEEEEDISPQETQEQASFWQRLQALFSSKKEEESEVGQNDAESALKENGQETQIVSTNDLIQDVQSQELSQKQNQQSPDPQIEEATKAIALEDDANILDEIEEDDSPYEPIKKDDISAVDTQEKIGFWQKLNALFSTNSDHSVDTIESSDASIPESEQTQEVSKQEQAFESLPEAIQEDASQGVSPVLVVDDESNTIEEDEEDFAVEEASPFELSPQEAASVEENRDTMMLFQKLKALFSKKNSDSAEEIASSQDVQTNDVGVSSSENSLEPSVAQVQGVGTTIPFESPYDVFDSDDEDESMDDEDDDGYDDGEQTISLNDFPEETINDEEVAVESHN